MENGDDLLKIFLSKRSLVNNESFENLSSSRKSSGRTYRMSGEPRDLQIPNGYATYSDSEADKLIEYHNLARSRICIEQSQNGYVVRPSSDGSIKYLTQLNELHQININSIENLNLAECNSTVTTDSVDSVNTSKRPDLDDEDRFSVDTFNESYPKQVCANTRQKPKRRISPIDEISENSINSAKLKEYFAKKDKEKLAEEKEVHRIISEAQRLSACRPVSRKKSNYDFLRNVNNSYNSQKVQQNNYILFYNEYFETSSAQGENQSVNSIDHGSCASFSTTERDSSETRSSLRRPSISRTEDYLVLDDLNLSRGSSSASCCCAKLFKSFFCRTGKTERKTSGINQRSSKSSQMEYCVKKEI